jgi:HAD superfamily hydrolase (TIGR01484 family)
MTIAADPAGKRQEARRGTPRPAQAGAVPLRTHPPIQLVALDLDGTILERGQHIRSAVVQALQALSARGIRWTTATGRPLAFQLEQLQQHGLGPGAATPAALMVDERELFLCAMPNAERGAEGNGADVPSYQPHAAWNSGVRVRWHTLHPFAMAWLDRAHDEAAGRGWPASLHLSEVEAAARGLPTLQLEQPAQAAAICDWLAEQLAASAPALACNRNVRLVQLHDVHVGKGPVLAELARLWNIPAAQVLAIGDSHNDLSMLDDRFGFQVATVGNADEHIKALVTQRGGYVADGVAGEGVLQAFAAYGLSDREGRDERNC